MGLLDYKDTVQRTSFGLRPEPVQEVKRRIDPEIDADQELIDAGRAYIKETNHPLGMVTPTREQLIKFGRARIGSKEHGFLGEIGAGLGRGALRVAATPAYLADVAGEALGWKGLERAGEWGAEKVEKFIEESPRLRKSASISGDIRDNPQLWTDPNWYAAIVFEGAPTIASMFIPGMAAARAARAAGMGVKAVQAARMGGALAAGMGLEAGGAAEDIRQYEKRTGEKVPISKKLQTVTGTGVIAGSLEAVPVFNIFGSKIAKKLIGRIITSMALEGGTEGAQEIVANAFAKVGYDADRDMVGGVIESVVGGVLLGGGMGAMQQTFQERIQNTDSGKVSDLLEQAEKEITTEQQTATIFNSMLDEGMTTGEITTEVDGVATKEAFTPETAIEVIRQAYATEILTDENLEQFREKYPALKSGLNEIIGDNVAGKINQEIEDAERVRRETEEAGIKERADKEAEERLRVRDAEKDRLAAEKKKAEAVKPKLRHEMTLDEFVEETRRFEIEEGLSPEEVEESITRETERDSHKRRMLYALEQGKKIPRETLLEYSDDPRFAKALEETMPKKREPIKRKPYIGDIKFIGMQKISGEPSVPLFATPEGGSVEYDSAKHKITNLNEYEKAVEGEKKEPIKFIGTRTRQGKEVPLFEATTGRNKGYQIDYDSELHEITNLDEYEKVIAAKPQPSKPAEAKPSEPLKEEIKGEGMPKVVWKYNELHKKDFATPDQAFWDWYERYPGRAKVLKKEFGITLSKSQKGEWYLARKAEGVPKVEKEKAEVTPEKKKAEKIEKERFLYKQGLDDISIRMLEEAKRKTDIDYKRTIETAQKIAKLENEKLSQEHIAEAIQYAADDFAIIDQVINSKKEVIDGKTIWRAPTGEDFTDILERVEEVLGVKPKEAKPTEPTTGFAWIKGKQKPIMLAREIKSGKNKDKYQITLTKGRDAEGNIIPGAKKIVGVKDIITMPGLEAEQRDRRLPAEVRGEKKFATKEAYEKDLIAYHNTTEGELLEALESGGLAMPSIAITRKDIPYEKYGPITLVGRKETIDPTGDRANRVFDSDIYSPRVPGKEWKLNKNQADEVYDRFEAVLDEVGAYKYSFEEAYKKGKEQFINYADRSNALKVAFLREQNIPIQIPKSPVGFHASLSENKDIQEYLKNLDYSIVSIDYKSKEHKQLSDAIKQSIDKEYKGKPEGKFISKTISESWFEEDGLLSFGFMSRFERDQKILKEKSIEVDKYKLEDRLKKKFTKKLSDQYLDWINEIADPMYGEPFIMLGRKKVPYTLGNIVLAMKREGLKGKEKTLTFGAAKARAVAAKQIPSIKAMHGLKGRLVTEEKIQEAIENQEKVQDALTSELIKHYRHKDWRGDVEVWAALDNSMKSVGTFLSGKNRTTDRMQTILHRNGFDNVSKMLARKAINFSEMLMGTPTQYFEMKSQRAVGFDEFEGIVIPTDSSLKLRRALKEAGLKVKTYKKYDPEGRQKAISSFYKRKDVLFATKATKPQETITRKDLREIFTRMKNVVTGQDNEGNFFFRVAGRPRVTIYEVDEVSGYINTSSGQIPVGSYLGNKIELKTGGVGHTADISTAWHEYEHWMESAGILSANDIKALDTAIDKATVTEEDRATYVGDRLATWKTQANTRIKRILKKISDFMDTVWELVLRTRTAEGVIRDIESGRILKEKKEALTGVNEFAQSVSFSLKKAAKAVTDNPNFVKWFGDTEHHLLAEEAGAPRIMYRGMAQRDFDTGIIDSRKKGSAVAGYFTNLPEGAQQYADRILEGDGVVKEFYVAAENVFNDRELRYLDEVEKDFIEKETGQTIDDLDDDVLPENKKFIKALKGLGYDAIETEGNYPYTEICPFEPTQIKSIYNTGAFGITEKDIRYQMAGKKAIGAPTGQLVKAQEMLAEGKSEKEVWRETGWLKGVEKKDTWKFEIDDSEMKFIYGTLDERAAQGLGTGFRKMGTLDKIIFHPELFKAYPELKNVKIERIERSIEGAVRFAAAYDTESNTITVKTNDLYDWTDEPLKQNADLQDFILHEVQHIIQEIEGFAKGGSPQGAIQVVHDLDLAKARLKNSPEFIKYGKQLDVLFAMKDLSDSEFSDKIKQLEKDAPLKLKQLWEMPQYEGIAPLEIYKRLAGEIEARDTAARAKLTPKQRREQMPYEAEGIPREDWIITKGEGTSFSVGKGKQFATKPTPEYTEMLKRYQGAHTASLIDEAIDETKIKHFPSLEKKGAQPAWIKEKFGRTEKTFTDKIGDNVGAFRKNWQTRLLDKLHPIKALGETAYMLHRLETGAQATMSMFMRHGKLRWKGKALTVDTQKQGFMPWLDSLGDDAQKLFYWMSAKRAEVLETEGREKWLDKDTRKNIFDWVGDKPESAKSWKVLNDQFQEFNKSVLDLAQQSGLINAGRRAAWEQEFYVPFYRIFEDGIAKEEFLKGPLMSKKHISAQIKRLTGAEMKIGDPLENIIRNWSHLIHESVRNTARAEAYNFAQKNNMKAGVTDDSGNLLPLLETVKASDLNIYRSDKEKRMVYVTKKGDDNILSFQKNGHKVYFKVNDAELFNALSDVNHRQFNGFLIRAFGQAKRWLTYGATFGPAFKVANMLRDTLHTSIISKSFIPFIDSGKGIVKALREDADYVKFMASGAGFGSSYIRAENPQALAEYVNRIVKKEGEGATQRILDTPKKMLDFWEKLGAASENAARVQLYTKRIAEGETHLKAAFEGRDLMDFTMRGDSQVVQYLIRTVPFMNARAQGLYKLGRAAKQDPKSFMIKGSMLTIATLALWAINRDKDEWKELEDWDKRTYYHFWIGDKHYRVPKPFETGAIFSTMFEGMAETMSGDEEFGYFVDVMKDTFLDTFAMNPLPQAIRPLIEQWSNKSFFTGRPIEGQSLQRLRPGERKTAWTSETMQLAGKLGVSPKRAEEIIRGYFSTFGMFLLGTSDIFAYHLADFPTNPTREINDYPLLGRFIKERVPARHTKYQTKFYEMFREVDQLVATVNNHRRLGNYKKATALATKERKNLRKREGLLKVRKELTEINAKLRRTMASRVLTAEQKRTTIDGLIKRKNRATRNIYERYLE